MATIEDRLKTARLRLQQKQPKAAIKLLRGILRDAPNHIESLGLLANLALAHHKPEMARELLERATQLRPGNGLLRMNLGVAYSKLGRLDDALAELHRAVRFRPQDGMVHFNLGEVQFAKGLHNDAGHSYQRAIHLRPNFTPARYRFARLLEASGAINAAVVAYQKLLELEPKRDDAYVDLGNVLRRCGNDEKAIDCYRVALKLNPRSVSAHNNLANSLRDHGKLAEALAHARRAIEIAPNNPILHNGAGLAFELLGQYDNARSAFQKAIELDADYSNAHYNLGGLYQATGDLELAEAALNRAIECDPDKAEARYRLALGLLLQGEFERAWPNFLYRWRIRGGQSAASATFEQPMWDGEPILDKCLYLHADNDWRDAIQFVRYAKLVRPLVARIILECPRRLTHALADCEGVDEVVAAGEETRPGFDVHAPLASLPALLGTPLEAIPAQIPYIDVDPRTTEKWRERLGTHEGLRIGIAWHGGGTNERSDARSIPLSQFAGGVALPGVTFFSLQKNDVRPAPARENAAAPLVALGSELERIDVGFDDTAGVIQNLDLVIATDTAIAHLAGALGTPVWVLLGSMPDWRWMLHREDSPWYPTMKLFRQATPGDWSGVLAQVQNGLQEFIASRNEAGQKIRPE